jgi:hypothetical protein
MPPWRISHGASALTSNEQLVTRIFGNWPSFHDAEVLSVRLDRDNDGHDDGPTLEAVIHVHRMTSQIDSRGYYVAKDHTLVTLRFNRVDDLELHDFNAQNVLFELRVEDLSELGQEDIHFDVVFRSSYGISAHFVCREIKVVSATPWVPPSPPRP